jgi:hypothetical protein
MILQVYVADSETESQFRRLYDDKHCIAGPFLAKPAPTQVIMIDGDNRRSLTRMEVALHSEPRGRLLDLIGDSNRNESIVYFYAPDEPSLNAFLLHAHYEERTGDAP